MLTIFGEDAQVADISKEDIAKGLTQALAMKRFKDAWRICLLLNQNEAWKTFAEEVARNLDIELAIQVLYLLTVKNCLSSKIKEMFLKIENIIVRRK